MGIEMTYMRNSNHLVDMETLQVHNTLVLNNHWLCAARLFIPAMPTATFNCLWLYTADITHSS